MSTRRTEQLRLLLPLALRQPREFCDRLRTKWEGLADRQRLPSAAYRAERLADGLEQLSARLGTNPEETLREREFLNAQREVASTIARLVDCGRFTTAHNADFTLASVVYLVCRQLRPAVVVETGVAYGVTSSFVLLALERNGVGELWSVDLPPLGRDADQYVGALVPQHLRSRWHLHRGVSRRLLPRILPPLGRVDVFIHDSLHTYRNMLWEFETVWPFLAPGGMLISDDIGGNSAFAEFSEKVGPEFSFVIREEDKNSLFGVLRKRGESPTRT
jgi:hypothetical protein